MADIVNAGMLRAFIERIERVEEEIRTLNADKSEIYKELRGVGFDVKAVRQCVAARKLDSAEREERNAIFDLYWDALTRGPRVHVHEGRDATTPHASNPKGFSVKTDDLVTASHDPETGEITEHEQLETAHEIHERPSTNAEASPEAGPQAEASQSQGTGAGTLAGHEGRSEGEAASACLPTKPPSAATPAEPEAVSPTPPAASGTISPSSGSQGVTGGNPSEPSPDAGAEDEPAPAGRKNAQSEQAAHHFDDDVPAFLKQERAERQPNPKCQKPGNCKWVHGQVSCWRCNSAPAARESEVA